MSWHCPHVSRLSPWIGLTLAIGFTLSGSTLTSADETRMPPVGQTATYVCQGTYGGEYEYTVEAAENGTLHYRLQARGYERELTMPVWFLGTSLYLEDKGSGYGTGRMTAGLDGFAGLRTLSVGSEFTGDVTEVASGQGSTTWHYTIKVAEKRKITDPVLGDVDVYVITERRSSGGRSSEREAHLSPTNAELVYSKYSDNEGKKRECHITALERSS